MDIIFARKMLTTSQLRAFFSERPQLSTHGMAKECKISNRLLYYILSGERKLTKKTAAKLLPVMVKYGLKFIKTDEEIESDILEILDNNLFVGKGNIEGIICNRFATALSIMSYFKTKKSTG